MEKAERITKPIAPETKGSTGSEPVQKRPVVKESPKGKDAIPRIPGPTGSVPEPNGVVMVNIPAINSILKYLGTKPYNEGAALMNDLQNNSKVVTKPLLEELLQQADKPVKLN